MMPSVQPTAAQVNMPQRTGIVLLGLYVFLLLARLPEVIVAHFGTTLHIAMIMLAVLSISCLFGGIARGFASTPGILLIVFTLWMFMGIPFSVWKGGSVKILTDYWIPSLLIFFTTAGLINSVKDCWRICWAICLAMAFLVTFGTFLFGAAQDAGRFNFGVGTLANANLLGQHLLFGLPFCLLMVKRSGPMSWSGFIGILSTVLLLGMIIKTGSRASMVALLVMAGVFFLEASIQNKMKLVVLYAALILGVIVFAPAGAMERYKLMFSSGGVSEDQVVDTAKASSEARMRHLQQSIALTKANPLFGVGPGMFTVAAADYAVKQNIKADWLETHNTFTQLSSETGLPGVILYVMVLVISIKSLFSVIKRLKNIPELKEYTNIAIALRLSFIGTIAAALFANLAYQYYFPLLAGICVSFVAVTEHALREFSQKTQPLAAAGPKLILGRSNRPKGAMAYPGPSISVR
jgi:O-antigen ligase